MFRIFSRIQLAYLGVFVVICAGLFAYEAYYVWPVQRCEANGDWWDAKDHECATPLQIWQITGRTPHPAGAPAPAAAPKP